jgi:hypothetical protein
MTDDNDSNVAPPDPGQHTVRHAFLGWQCRIRQLSVRQDAGKPTAGMRPRVLLEPGDKVLGHIIVLIRKKRPRHVTAQFQHMARKTRDPAERHDSALRFLAAAYYQQPQAFSDQMTALFGPRSEIADRLVEAGKCRLEFEQYGQRYKLQCRVNELVQSDPAFQFTYWHNSLFNPGIPEGVRVLGFVPDWSVECA